MRALRKDSAHTTCNRCPTFHGRLPLCRCAHNHHNLVKVKQGKFDSMVQELMKPESERWSEDPKMHK